MIRYTLQRLLMMIPLLFGITLLSFLIIQMAPGAPLGLALDLNPEADPTAVLKMREHFGLDRPLWVQYSDWIWRLLQLDFGVSFAPDGRAVIDKLADALPVTLALNGIGLVLVLLLALPIGTWSARNAGSVADKSTTVLLFIGFAAPSFWLGILALSGLVNLMYAFPEFSWPLSGISDQQPDWPWWRILLDYLQHLTLPLLVSLLATLTALSRYVRSSLLDVMAQDYLLTARSKGLSEAEAVRRHALPNALLPVITLLGLSVPGLIGGSVIIETLFALPGMGKLFYESVLMRDYPVIMAIVTIGAVLTLIGNLLADLAYAWADPRLRREAA